MDQYNQENSRDCEPMAGGHTDNYYYQMAAWIRRFKGVRPGPTAPGPRTLTMDGQFNDWDDISLEFHDTIGDIQHRDHRGYGGHIYKNNTGRNDFVRTQASYDGEHVYFFVQTHTPITAHTDPMWMLLLLDTDQDAGTGWLGYDDIVNQEVIDTTATTVKCWQDGTWIPAGRATYRVKATAWNWQCPVIGWVKPVEIRPSISTGPTTSRASRAWRNSA